MEIRQLKTFLMVAQLKNFTKAGEILGYTQPTITNQIQLLESELGVLLFERIKKKIDLTQDGIIFLKYAKKIVDLEFEALNCIKNTEFEKSIRVGTTESCAFYLEKILPIFYQKFPKASIEVKTMKAYEYLNLLSNNEIDLAICLDQKINNSELLIHAQVFEPICFWAHPANELFFKDKIFPKDLAKNCLILAEKDCSYRKCLQNEFEKNNIFPKSIIEIESITTMKQLAINGLGIILLPLISVESERKESKLLNFNWGGNEFEFFCQILTHKEKIHFPLLNEFINIVKVKIEERKSLCLKK